MRESWHPPLNIIRQKFVKHESASGIRFLSLFSSASSGKARKIGMIFIFAGFATLAQLVEQLIRNEQVGVRVPRWLTKVLE